LRQERLCTQLSPPLLHRLPRGFQCVHACMLSEHVRDISRSLPGMVAGEQEWEHLLRGPDGHEHLHNLDRAIARSQVEARVPTLVFRAELKLPCVQEYLQHICITDRRSPVQCAPALCVLVVQHALLIAEGPHGLNPGLVVF
jgi:hypothetical protein